MRFFTRLYVYLFTPIAVLTVASGIGVASNWGAEQRFSRLFEREQARADAVSEMYAHGLQMGQALRNIVLDPAKATGYDNFAAASKAYAEAAARAEALGPGHPSGPVLAEIAAFRDKQAQAQTRLLALVKTDAAAAMGVLNKEETPTWREMRSRLLELRKQSAAEMNATRDEALAATGFSANAVLACTLVALALAVFFTLAIRRTLLRDLGGEPEVARELVALAKTMPAIELKGAILDGIVFKGNAGVEELSKFPTKDEAIGQIVTLVLSPARNVLGQVAGPVSTVAGLVKAIETKLEKGETIAAVG